MPVAAADQSLYQIVSGAAPTTIDDVLKTMESIDQLLADGDGLKWFNRLYLMVTKEVDLRPPAGGWKDANWLLQLDVSSRDFISERWLTFCPGSRRYLAHGTRC